MSNIGIDFSAGEGFDLSGLMEKTIASQLGANYVHQTIHINKYSSYVLLDEEYKKLLDEGYKIGQVTLNGIIQDGTHDYTVIHYKNNLDFLRVVDQHKPLTEEKLKELRERFLTPSIVFGNAPKKGDVITVTYKK